MKTEINENELIEMLPENEEEIKNIIYEQYGYIIDILLKKYSNVIKMFQVDMDEIRCEASYGFSDGINSYSKDKEASLKTFLTLCIERRITKYLSKYTTNKAKMIRQTLSIDEQVENSKSLVKDVIPDENQVDPLDNLTYFETFDEIVTVAKETLSSSEYEVFIYMIKGNNYKQIAQVLGKTPKQVDNTIQRIKTKMRKALDNLKIS